MSSGNDPFRKGCESRIQEGSRGACDFAAGAFSQETSSHLLPTSVVLGKVRTVMLLAESSKTALDKPSLDLDAELQAMDPPRANLPRLEHPPSSLEFWITQLSPCTNVTSIYGDPIPHNARTQTCEIHVIESTPECVTDWRAAIGPLPPADLVIVNDGMWMQPTFVTKGLPQLCHHLRYGGQFIWLGKPDSGRAQRTKQRAHVLRLCSLHGLKLLEGTQDQDDRPFWILERRNPVATMLQER